MVALCIFIMICLFLLSQKLKIFLARLLQEPPKSTQDALFPAKQTLIVDKLFRHGDSNVQVAVAICICQFTRVTCPNQTYSDDQMKEFESFLARLLQEPHKSTQDALLPAKQKLIADKLLRHGDSNVQVAVPICICQLTRVTCPDQTYSDDQMKIFETFLARLLKELPSLHKMRFC